MQKGIEVCSVSSDNGYSGLTFNRPDYQEMILDIKANKIDCLVAKDLSRFSRSHLGASEVISRVFPRAGIRMIAVTDHFDSLYAKPDIYNLFIPLKTLINQAYSMDISRKISSQLDIKRQKGEYIGAFPAYGYRKSEYDCHQNLIRINSQGYYYYYYSCGTAKKQRGACSSHRIRCDKLENLVQQQICQRIRDVLALKKKAMTEDCALQLMERSAYED